MEVLGHHDVGQLVVHDFRGFFHVFQVIHDVALGHRCHGVGNHRLAHFFGLRHDVGLPILGVIHQSQHLLCSFARQTRNVRQAVLRIRQLFGGTTQAVCITQLAQGIMQLPREHADFVVDIALVKGAGRCVAVRRCLVHGFNSGQPSSRSD